jgi:acetyl esterase/lipase
MSPRLLPLILVSIFAASAGAADPEVLLLWPQGAPGAKGERAEDKPQITVSLPAQDQATGAAMVVCPGGGYGNLAMDHEGRQIAEWLNSFGVAAAVLEYRHRGKGYGHPAPLQDAQRALRTVRANAEKWASIRSASVFWDSRRADIWPRPPPPTSIAAIPKATIPWKN